MTETDLAKSWGLWLTAQLAEKGWRQADLVRESGGLIKRDRASKWSSGNERPTYRLAVVTANALRVPIDEALDAAGYTAVYEVPAHMAAEEEERRAYELTPEGASALENSFAQYELTEALSNFLSDAGARSAVLATVPHQELLAELGRRLSASPLPQINADVPGDPQTQDDYDLAARPRATDRGEDMV